MLRSLSLFQKLLIAAVLVGFLVYQLVLIGSRSGETKVTVTVIPGDASVTINGRPSSAGGLYLKPGRYEFSASREGFETDKQSVEVGKEPVEVGLIPAPKSKAADQFLADNPELQLEREAIGGQRANQKGEDLRTKNPLMDNLPITDLVGPFSIDYGLSQTRPDSIFLEISNSSPDGRTNALRWIRQQNQDPTDLEIRYLDFTNPFRVEET